MLDWNDLKYFVAVAQHGSTLAAGRALAVDQSTVQRRLTALERHIGRALVRRHTTGYRLTDFGTEVLEAARQVERAVGEFEQVLVVSKRNAAGAIRLTCPEPLVDRLMRSGLLDRFHALHPNLHVEFVMSDKYVDLRTGEADVALRFGAPENSELLTRRVGTITFGLYVATHLHGEPDIQARLPFIGFGKDGASIAEAEWLVL